MFLSVYIMATSPQVSIKSGRRCGELCTEWHCPFLNLLVINNITGLQGHQLVQETMNLVLIRVFINFDFLMIHVADKLLGMEY